ncbi:hypothetical protein OJF2_08540 [Aquisphaera giovannonii]|uniref:Uncharacterized protein n=1 Tax=Aquisphaera giovannonii TaxID=406548 RepID=A0A5B9VWE5_9BACT|nr:DUF4265 domain-containing protein [Aquisphaera giovannonii]QEH32384.1 hypothetical protein OJF2_08540 [Aquisphaera giovannonii]
MVDDVAIDVQTSDSPLVDFPGEGVAMPVAVEKVGDRLYRLIGVPVLAESASFGDVIEAEPVEGGGLRFVRVAEPGGWRTFLYALPAYKLDGAWAWALLEELTARGGHWEQVLFGLLFLCLPPGLDLDPTPWVESVWPWPLVAEEVPSKSAPN